MSFDTTSKLEQAKIDLKTVIIQMIHLSRCSVLSTHLLSVISAALEQKYQKYYRRREERFTQPTNFSLKIKAPRKIGFFTSTIFNLRDFRIMTAKVSAIKVIH